LEVEVEDNRIVKVRPDKDNPKSEGYVCRKGMNIAFHQHNADRLLYPLKKVGDGFERVSWDQAIGEIAEKLKSILHDHGSRSLAWLASTQSCMLGATFLTQFCRILGSRYFYTALGQEHTGRYWAHGLTLGSQGFIFEADHKNTDMLMTVGWNPMMSHGMQQARREIMAISKNPEQLLVAIDPRLSETAKVADIHLALRPGTDALLFKSMIAIILREKMHNQEYIDKHVDGLSEILPWFADFDVNGALKVCELEYDEVFKVCREFATRKSCLHDDLGILMNRHSSLVSYLLVVLLAICGRICMLGGNYFSSRLFGGRAHSDPDDPKTWRTAVTDFPAIQAQFPPNVMPEEIDNDHPDRLRALFTFGANALRSYADTTAYENAFRRLELLVTTEMVMSETAAVAHYVLPSKSAYESWDSFFSVGFPEVYFQMRRPVVEAEGEQKEAGEIFTLLADAMGLVPELPESLYEVAKTSGIKEYRDALVDYVKDNPESSRALPFIAAKTLGSAIGSSHLAGLLTMLQRRPQTLQEEAARAGFAMGPKQDLDIYQAIIDHPEGALVGLCDPEKNIEELATKNGRIQLYAAEVEDWMKEINPADEEEHLKLDDKFPLILIAGRHMDMNANTNMRDPAWNKGRRACTLAMNPADTGKQGFSDGQMVKIITEAGEETIEVEATEATRKGQVIIPHGFGLVYNGVKYGANVNRLTKNTHRDRIAGTPIHRYIPCRVEAV